MGRAYPLCGSFPLQATTPGGAGRKRGSVTGRYGWTRVAAGWAGAPPPWRPRDPGAGPRTSTGWVEGSRVPLPCWPCSFRPQQYAPRRAVPQAIPRPVLTLVKAMSPSGAGRDLLEPEPAGHGHGDGALARLAVPELSATVESPAPAVGFAGVRHAAGSRPGRWTRSGGRRRAGSGRGRSGACRCRAARTGSSPSSGRRRPGRGRTYCRAPRRWHGRRGRRLQARARSG